MNDLVIGTFRQENCKAGCMCFDPSDGQAHIVPDKTNVEKPQFGKPCIIEVVNVSIKGNMRFGRIHYETPLSRYFEIHRVKIKELLPAVVWPKRVRAGVEFQEITWQEGKSRYSYGLMMEKDAPIQMYTLVATPRWPRVLAQTGYTIRFPQDELKSI